MATDKLLGAVSLCRKAGKLVGGRDAVEKSARGGACALVLLAQDLAPRSLEQARRFCLQTRTPCKTLPRTMEQLSPILGGKQVGILAVCDQGFARMIVNQLP